MIAEMNLDDAEPQVDYLQRPWELLTPLARGGPREANVLDEAQQRITKLDPSLIALFRLYDSPKHGEAYLCYRREELAAGRSTVFGLPDHLREGCVAERLGDSLGTVLCEYHEARVVAAEAEYESPRNGGAGSIDWGEVEHEHEYLALARDLVRVTADRIAGRTSRNPPWTNRSLARHLIAAAEKDDVARLRALIDRGAPIDPSEGEDSALIVAIRESKLAAARCLLEAGANLNHRGRSVGIGPLDQACRSSDLAMIEFVIDSGASLDGSDLLRAAAHRSRRELVASILALLVKRGLDPNYERYGWTILMAVCLCGDLGTARLLLDRGADPNRGEKETPLSVAKEKGYEVLVDLLLERGAVK